jgi:hypothetical protein
MNKRWINTKVEFIWDGSQYVEQSVDGYWYDGEMALCTVTHSEDVLIDLTNDAIGLGVYSTHRENARFHSSESAQGTRVWITNSGISSTQGYGFVVGDGNVDTMIIGAFGTNGSYTTKNLCLDRTGRVGIGTVSPTQLFHVFHGNGSAPTDSNTHAIIESNDHCYLGIYGGDDRDTGIHFGDTAIMGRIQYKNVGNCMTFGTNGSTEAMRIDSSQRVGIGTNDPQYPLDVTSDTAGYANMIARDTRAYDTSSGGLGGGTGGGVAFGGKYSASATTDWAMIRGVKENTTSGNYAGFLQFGTRSQSGWSEKMRITSAGNVGIGDSSPSYKLEVAGTFYASGSSQAFKKNVTDLAIDSSAIYNLNPVSYNYKKDYEDFGYDLAEGKQFGLISEEVAEAVPELAIMKDGEPKNVDYQKLSVLLLAEMQKMNKRIEDLECHI